MLATMNIMELLFCTVLLVLQSILHNGRISPSFHPHSRLFNGSSSTGIDMKIMIGFLFQANQVGDYAQEMGLTCVKTYKMDACKALWDGTQMHGSKGIQQIHNEKVIARMARKARRRQILNQQPVKELKPAGVLPEFRVINQRLI